jgi:Gpi18-like mannosyltransferase
MDEKTVNPWADARVVALSLALVLLTGVWLRLPWLELGEHFDVKEYLLPTYGHLREGDLLFGLREHGGYLPLYTLMLFAAQRIFPGADALMVIKSLSILFDAAAAGTAYALVRLLRPQRPGCAVGAFCAVFLLPTVVINSAMWGQCDGIYCTFLLAAVYFGLRGRMLAASIAVGLAVALKPQGMIILPFYALLMLRTRQWRAAAAIPVIFLGCYVPALLQGYPPGEALGFLFRRIGDQPLAIDETAGSVFSLMRISKGYYDIQRFAGVVMAAIAACACVAVGWRDLLRRGDRAPMTAWLMMACLSALLLVFLLPSMQNRYFYFINLMTIVIAFTCRGGWKYALASGVSSLLAYNYFLRIYGLAPFPFLRGPELMAAMLNLWLAAALAKGYAESVRGKTGEG